MEDFISHFSQISGSRGEDKDQGEDNKSKKKVKQKPSKKIREPSFSTTLTTPIEEIIEETLNEEEAKPTKPRKRNKPKNKSKSTEQLTDEVGFSFFKVKSAEHIPKFEKKAETKATLEENPDEDPLGFSFLPVKDKKKRSLKVKTEDLPKTEPKKINEVVKNKVVDQKPEKCVEIVNRETGKKVYLEAKESKKVHSKISYASVASQRFEESLEQLRREEEKLKIAEDFEIVEDTDGKVNGSSYDLNLNKTPVLEEIEELVTEIESEERRLVDLIDEDHCKIVSGECNKIESETEDFGTPTGEYEPIEIFEETTPKLTESGALSKAEIVKKATCDFLTEETSSNTLEKPFKMSSGTQIRVLTLNDKEHQDSTLYRLQKNWILQFRLGPSLLGRKVLLYCNYPKENEEFKRHSYNLLKWQQDEGCEHSDDTALLTELTLELSGSFHYYFVYDDG